MPALTSSSRIPITVGHVRAATDVTSRRALLEGADEPVAHGSPYASRKRTRTAASNPPSSTIDISSDSGEDQSPAPLRKKASKTVRARGRTPDIVISDVDEAPRSPEHFGFELIDGILVEMDTDDGVQVKSHQALASDEEIDPQLTALYEMEVDAPATEKCKLELKKARQDLEKTRQDLEEEREEMEAVRGAQLCFCFRRVHKYYVLSCGHGPVHLSCLQTAMATHTARMMEARPPILLPPECPYCRQVMASGPTHVWSMDAACARGNTDDDPDTAEGYDTTWLTRAVWGDKWDNFARQPRLHIRDVPPLEFIPAAAAPDDPADPDYYPSDNEYEYDDTFDDSDHDMEQQAADDGFEMHELVVEIPVPLAFFNSFPRVLQLEPSVPQATIDLLIDGTSGDPERTIRQLMDACRNARLEKLTRYLPVLEQGILVDGDDAPGATRLGQNVLDAVDGDVPKLTDMHDRLSVHVFERIELLQPYLPLLNIENMRQLPPYIRRDAHGALHIVP